MKVYAIHYYEGSNNEDHLVCEVFANTMHDAVIIFANENPGNTILHVEQKYD